MADKNIKQTLEETGDSIKETATKVGHRISEKAEEAYDWTKEKAHEVGNKASELGHKAADKAQELGEKAKKTAEDLTSKARDAVHDVQHGERRSTSDITEHMAVYASCGKAMGKVDHVEGNSIKLTKSDSPDGQHHLIPLSWVDHVDNHVHLNKNSMEVTNGWQPA